jgi:polysaccharide export outer membrane protein
MRKFLAFAFVLAVSGGCAGLPNAGPRVSQVMDQAASDEARRMGVVLVELTPGTLDILKARHPNSLSTIFGEGAPAPAVIGIGDVLSVSLWEAGAGTLFSSPVVAGQALPPSRGSVLPNQTVQPDGMISIPFAGRIAVAGLEPAAAERVIAARLAGKATDPQVLVSVVSGVASSVTIAGGASGGARVPLSVRGDRILDVLASAGGLRIPPDDAVIYLTRSGRTVAIAYDAILDDPTENIFLMGSDLITVVSRPAAFLAFGAVQRNGQIPFDARDINLAEAVAKAAGLSDSRADPAGIFLFRYEDAALIQKIAPGRTPAGGAPVPVIYRLDLSDSAQYFLARQFAVTDKDILYVAGAPLNDLQKFFGVIGTILAPAANAVGVGAAAVTLNK